MSDDSTGCWEQYASEVDPSGVEAGEDEVVCHVCGGVYGQITAQHLRVHGLSLDEYKQQYPEAPIYPDDPDRHPGGALESHSEKSKKAISQAMVERHREGHYE